ncbi:MAG: PKD domain-containing protein [Candidatus Bathyarchaeota archaeon]|nr:PKD domain-containing protein [Candidatus Bathyarchaeota archaeon]
MTWQWKTPSNASKAMLSLVLFALLTGLLSPMAYGQSLAPDFTLTDIEGTSFSLSDYRGHVVLLEFMRTWCTKCQLEVSELVEVQNEFGDLITIISLGIDANETNEDLRQFRDSEGSWWWPPHDWIYARCPLSSIFLDQYNVTSTPTMYIIDQDGFIRYQHAGLGDDAVVDASVLIAEIRALLTYSVTIATSPSLDNVHFRIDGSDYYTSNGSIEVPLFHGMHQLELVDTMLEAGGVEYYFSHWNANASGSANPLQINVSLPQYIEVQYDTQDITSPIAEAGLDQIVNEDTLVTLDGSASTDNVGITEYAWTLLDGSVQTLTGVVPTYTFTMPGVYSVTLNVTDAAGNWATDTTTVTVKDITPPTADAGISQITHEAIPFLFNASESLDNVGIVSYLWTFLDDTVQTLTGVAPNYTFTTPGVYSVTLNVTDAAGNWATDTIAITVTVGVPTADAGLDQEVEEDTLVMLNGSASWDAQKVASYSWTFVDGSLQTLNGPTHEYKFADPGIYAVTLTVRDVFGTEATDALQITILDVTQPEARIVSDSTVAQGATLEFSGESSTDNGEIIQYTWDFGDDSQSTGITTNHVYSSPGDYAVTLTITDKGGNIDSTQQLVSVLPNGGGINVMMLLPILIVPGVLIVFILKRNRR